MIHVSQIKTGNELFRLRLIHQIQFFLKMWKLAVDWIVWIYIILPALGVALYFYVDLWRGTSGVATYFQEPMMILLIMLFCINGQMKSYFKEADILFLWQEKRIIKQFQHSSIIFFCLFTVLNAIIYIAALAPIVIIYLNWSLLKLWHVFVLITVLHVLIGLIKRELQIKKGKWAYRGWMSLVTLLIGALLFLIVPRIESVWMLLAGVVVGMLGIYYMIYRIQTKPQQFYREVEIEIEKKAKSVQLFFSQLSWIGAPDFLSEKAKNRSRKRPFLFRRSRKIFRSYSTSTGYVELFLKNVIRNQSWVLIYFQFIGAGVFTILIVPGKLKWGIWLLIVFVIGNVVRVFLKRVLDHPFLTVVSWPKVNQIKIAYHCLLVGLIPSSLILSILFGYLMFGLFGIVFGIVASAILSVVISRFFASKVVD
ncbi:ABC transporter permease [Bacillaceae bacterium W0354]